MSKLLVVFNTCGIARENPQIYAYNIQFLLDQIDDMDDEVVLAVSACRNSKQCAQYILVNCPGIYYNAIDGVLPISVTFNHTVEVMSTLFDFDDFMFVDSGITIYKDKALQRLYDLHKMGYGMTAARTDHDMGFDDWFKTDTYGSDLFASGHMVLPVGKAVNLHAQIFSRKIRDSYGKILPDIFAGQCMESTFSFLTAAVKQEWIVHKDVVVKHLTGMDVPSAGFSPEGHVRKTGKPRWDHTFWTKEPMLDIMKRGAKYGMGYEENQGILMHDPDCFDGNVCKNEELATYIRENLFLKDFNYNSIKFELMKNNPRKK